jgi:acetylcholinesterase/cholinesterase
MVSFRSFGALCVFSLVGTGAASNTTVQTSSGPLTGATLNGVSAFRGVPYAAAPVGPLRWQNPLPPAPWTAPRSAFTDGAACPQVCALPTATCPPTISEDCLFLNVFAPASAPPSVSASASAASATAPTAAADLKPVLFWIHGGNFYQGYGGGILYDGSHFARDHGVVVVSINYRLGALGFLYTGEDNATQLTGNFGLRDQRAAMQWVQANIAAFGGDPARVTIFGQSAGGASVGAHLNMAASKGLFHAAVMESNPIGLPFRTAKKYPDFSKVVAKKAGCKTGLFKAAPIEECLRGKSADAVVAAQAEAQNDLVAELGEFLSLFQPFSPVVGTDELPVQTLDGLLAGAVHDVPILLGSVRQEGVIFIYEAFAGAEPILEEAALLELVYGVADTPKIQKQYPMPQSAKDAKDARNHTALFATDSLFHCALRHAALSLAARTTAGTRLSPTYLYHFDHVISFGAKFWDPTSPICVDTVCHAEELPFVFNPDLSAINATFTADEATLAASMQTYWSNFARDGRPGANGALAWPPLDAAEKAMRFTTDPANSIDTGRYADKCAFWDKLGYKWIL